MSIHSHLPIYKVAYALLTLVVDLVKNMPRDFKSSFGGELRNECIGITVLIFRANSSLQKAPHIQTLLERLQVAELLIRLSCDMRFISKDQYARAIDLTAQIGKQATGWKKHSMQTPAA
jgi:hypothetical protein